MTYPNSAAASGVTAAEIQRLLAAELSFPSRLVYTALLLVGLGAATVTAALLATEAGLPARTQIAFGLLTAIGLSWSAFAAWVLARRRVLMAQHRVVAARMAIAFTAMLTAGSLVLMATNSARRPGLAAAVTGGVMLGISIVIHVRAQRHVERLTRRRDELERQLAARGRGA